ncbi:MAG: hypothetical protein ACOCP8_07255, partial [archaeon]
ETMGNGSIAYRFIVALAADLEVEYDYAIDAAFEIDIESQLKKIFQPFIIICVNSEQHQKIKEFFDFQISATDLENHFIHVLEKQRFNLNEDDNYRISKAFAIDELNNKYIFLNSIRQNIYLENFNQEFEEVNDFDYNNLNDFYGDIIYYILNQKADKVFNFLRTIKEKILNKFIKYLNEKYDDLDQLLLEFIDDIPEDISTLRTKKSFGRYLIAFDNEVAADSNDIIDKYLEAGTKYIEKLYNKAIIEDELIHELKNEEEIFLLYMNKALALKGDNIKGYVRYLRKALDSYPVMKNVVEYLISEVKEEQNKVYQKFEAEKNKFKTNIEILISNSQLKEAKKFIANYKDTFGVDADIYSMLGVIYIKRGELDRALTVLNEGVQKYNNNTDILFNLGYSYHLNNDMNNARFYLNHAKLNCESQDIKETINEILVDYKNPVKVTNIRSLSPQELMDFESGNKSLLNFRFEFDNIILWSFVRWRIFFRLRELFYNNQNLHGQKKPDKSLKENFKKNVMRNKLVFEENYPILYFGNSRNTVKNKDNTYTNPDYDGFINTFPQETLLLESAYNYEHSIPRNVENYVSREYINYLINNQMNNKIIKNADKRSIKNFINYLKEKFPIKFDEKFYNNLLNHLFSIAIKLSASKKVYKKIFSNLKTKIMFYHTASYMTEPHVIKWANEQNIVTAEFQHGVIGPYHYAYNFGDIFFNTELKSYLPRYLLTYGEIWNQVHTPSKRYNVGKPYLNSKIFSLSNNKKVNDENIILIISQGKVTKKLVNLALNLSKVIAANYQIIYRLHPGEISFESRYSELKKIKNIDIDFDSNIYELMETSDFIVGYSSTALFEALPLKKPIFVYESDETRTYIPKKIANWFNDAKELYKLINKNDYFIYRDYEEIWEDNSIEKYKEFIARLK